MSWEEMCTSTTPCPCGKGTISQAHYADDWNRYKDGEVIINCEECNKRYRIEGEVHYTSKGESYTTYYLTPKDYPVYDGIQESKVWGSLHNIDSIPFYEYLMENYSFVDLCSALNEYREKGNSAKVTGIARNIRDEHNRVFKSVRVSLIEEKIQTAILQYKEYQGTYEQRILTRMQEKSERKAYEAEKRKHQIKIIFR